MSISGPALALALASLIAIGAGISNPAWAQTGVDVAVEQANFEKFVREFRGNALSAGISPEVYDRATAGIAFNPHVEELNEKQPEFVRPIWDYLAGVITPERIERGRELMAVNEPLLRRLRVQYGVQPSILTAIWGIETGYGRTLGSFNLVEALTNLAFEGPRTAFGQRELLAALQIVQEQRIDPARMPSSWAGAFGQTQFVPTTFLKYAIDGNGDGRIDLWNSPADALASTANYLQQSGWQEEEWGQEVRLPDNFPFESADISIKKPVAEWAQLGVRPVAGEHLPIGDETASIILPAGHRGPAFLVLNNFDALLKYNNAIPYALAVGLLSDRLRGYPGVTASWPTDEPVMDIASAMALQQGLTELGFDTGGADGVFGARTRQAIRAYQQSRGLPADGFATSGLLDRVQNDRSAMH